jgi:hypothetical protein
MDILADLTSGKGRESRLTEGYREGRADQPRPQSPVGPPLCFREASCRSKFAAVPASATMTRDRDLDGLTIPGQLRNSLGAGTGPLIVRGRFPRSDAAVFNTAYRGDIGEIRQSLGLANL